MYIPKEFKIAEESVGRNFIRKNNFGLLISNNSPFPSVTHLPFYPEAGAEFKKIFTHIAKANHHPEIIKRNKEVLLVFNGPHGYVSPSHYENEVSVPTWNYITVHASGTAKLIEDHPSIQTILSESIRTSEPEYLQKFDKLPNDYLSAMMNAIYGIEIDLQKIEIKFKLSQNKKKSEIASIANDFEKSGHTELAIAMRKINNV